MRARIATALALALGLAAAAPASAQPAPAPTAQRREEIKRRIRTLRAYALTTELGLDERSGARLWPVFARYDDELDKLVQQRVEATRRLREAARLRDPRAQNLAIDAALANQRALWGLEERRLAELRKILTPGQIARLLVVLPAFERRIQNQLRRAIVRGSGGNGRARRALRRGLDLDDDDLGDDLDDDLDGDAAPPPRPRTPRLRRR